MSTATKTRRNVWTVDEWTTFTEKARGVQDRLWYAIKAAERIPGYRVKIGDTIVHATNYIDYALLSCEDILEWDCGVNPMAILYGHRTGFTPMPDERFAHLPDPYRTAMRRSDTLSLEAWATEGVFVRATRDDLLSLQTDLASNFPKTKIKRPAMYLARATGKFTTARAYLEVLLAKHHPTLYAPSKFFFGEITDGEA